MNMNENIVYDLIEADTIINKLQERSLLQHKFKGISLLYPLWGSQGRTRRILMQIIFVPLLMAPVNIFLHLISIKDLSMSSSIVLSMLYIPVPVLLLYSIRAISVHQRKQQFVNLVVSVGKAQSNINPVYDQVKQAVARAYLIDESLILPEDNEFSLWKMMPVYYGPLLIEVVEFVRKSQLSGNVYRCDNVICYVQEYQPRSVYDLAVRISESIQLEEENRIRGTD